MTNAAYRLPVTARPRRYELELAPDLDQARFDGTVTVSLELIEPVDRLTFNAAELSISEAELAAPDGTVRPVGVTFNEAEQQATVDLGTTVPAGEGYQLRLVFQGVLNDQLHGFYRSTFTGEDGTQHVIATSQMEPADARRAFPCWDEPEFKAVFSVALVVAPGLTALSNGAEEASEPLEDGRRRIRFADTMPMSTYLVAFVVGPFELTGPDGVEGVPVRIAAVPGRSHLTSYAVEAAAHALRFLSRYFEIPYPGGKIDHVAIPDFAFGAMENLGCVTYRENALLVDPATASQLELQRVATVIAHESAHMWFGDLVTMRWWNGIWLNEAFATFMELTTTDAFNPDWQVWTAFGAGRSAAMAIDGLRATRPVEFAVGRPEEAEAMFDVLTYQKGGAVLRMLEQYLGPETFRKGIAHYLSVHAYGNTETTDLWDAIEEVSGEPVRAIMDSWIQQGGYPLIHVERGTDPSTLTLRQTRFLYDGGTTDDRWAVPVNLRASVGGETQRQRLLLDRASATVTFDGPVDWVVVNDGSWGFYRTRYAPDLMEGLVDAGLPGVCGPLERLAVLTDTWAAVVAGLADVREWFAALDALGGDDDPDVWAAVGAVFSLLKLVSGDEDQPALQAAVRRAAGPVFARLGWDPAAGESRRAATARARVLGALGLTGADPATVGEVAERFERFVETGSGLAPDLVSTAARILVAGGGEAAWSRVLSLYRRTTNPQDKLRYLYALAETTDPDLIGRTLDLALSDDVRSQDAPFLVAAVMSTRAGARPAWDWVGRRWEELQAKWQRGLLARMFDGVTSLVEPDAAESVHAFCASHEMPLVGPRLAQLLERMDINVGLAARLGGTLATALEPTD